MTSNEGGEDSSMEQRGRKCIASDQSCNNRGKGSLAEQNKRASSLRTEEYWKSEFETAILDCECILRQLRKMSAQDQTTEGANEYFQDNDWISQMKVTNVRAKQELESMRETINNDGVKELIENMGPIVEHITNLISLYDQIANQEQISEEDAVLITEKIEKTQRFLDEVAIPLIYPKKEWFEGWSTRQITGTASAVVILALGVGKVVNQILYN